MRLWGIVVLLLGLSACALVNENHTPKKPKSIVIDCSGSALNWGVCTNKAIEFCGNRGYKLLESSGNEAVTLASDTSGTYASTMVDRSITVRCTRY